MRFQTRIIFGFLAVVLAVSLVLRHVSGPRVVARAVAPDGTEMCVVQKCNWSAEPFTTRFVFRKPGGTWGSFYYDHQDDYWGTSRVVLDTNAGVAVFYRGNSSAVTFAWAKETYTLLRWNHTLTGAQWQLPAGWTPQMSLR